MDETAHDSDLDLNVHIKSSISEKLTEPSEAEENDNNYTDETENKE